jgi:3-oxoacyl-[acyl-carrier protein] reductase
MDLGLTGRAALVTGGRSGIGAAVALALAGEGCDVAIVDRVADAQADAVAARIAALGRRPLLIATDVRDFAGAESAVERAAATFGRLDVLVCCAGITADAPSWKMTEEQWRSVLDVNLTGCFTYLRAAAARFRTQRSGRMVAISSINGLRGKFGQANYAASKAGVIALGRSLATELGRYDVTVNVVAPGMVRTPMAEALPVEVLQRAVEETVLGRLATPEEIAAAVVFLCSERARHITGTVLTVDGGQLL